MNCEKTLLENLAFIGTIVVPIIALLAVGIAVWQIRSNAGVQRRSTAYNLYQQYLTLAIQNPDIAYGSEKLITMSRDDYAKYKWFVASMLVCFEEILIACPNESDWVATIDAQLHRHSWHLSRSSSIRAKHWKQPLLRLVHNNVLLYQRGEFGTRDSPKDRGTISFRLGA